MRQISLLFNHFLLQRTFSRHWL